MEGRHHPDHSTQGAVCAEHSPNLRHPGDLASGRRPMTFLDQLGVLLTDLPIYLANGMLVILYWLAAHSAALVSLACALLIILLPDAQVQSRAGYRPSRHEEVAPNGATLHTAQIMTGIVLIAWLIAQWDMGAPVPWIGAVMWAAGLIAVLTLNFSAFQLALVRQGWHRHVRPGGDWQPYYLGYTSHLTAEQWAALVGSSESAATLIASTRGNVTDDPAVGSVAGRTPGLFFDAGAAGVYQPDVHRQSPGQRPGYAACPENARIVMKGIRGSIRAPHAWMRSGRHCPSGYVLLCASFGCREAHTNVG